MYSIDDILNGDIDDDNQNVVHEDEAIEDNTHNDEDNEVKKDENDEDKPAKKVRKQSQRPLLNAERLKGPRGLICMEKTFSKIKFQGHGKEQQDLDAVMTALQHWCHRLYPKYTFDDTIDQLEKLGIKKPVVVLRKKIIMNMLEDEIFALNKSQEEADEPELPPIHSPPRPQIDKFDSLFGEDRPPLKRKEPTPEQELTDEMQAMIERNRMLAAERRKARLEAQENKEKENSSSVLNVLEIGPSTSYNGDSVPILKNKNRLLDDNNMPSTSKKLSAFERESLSKQVDSLQSSNIEELPSFVSQESSMDVPAASQESESSNIDLPSFVSQDTPMDIAPISQEKSDDSLPEKIPLEEDSLSEKDIQPEKIPSEEHSLAEKLPSEDSLPEKLQSEEDSLPSSNLEDLPSFVSDETPMETEKMLE